VSERLKTARTADLPLRLRTADLPLRLRTTDLPLAMQAESWAA